MEPEQFCDMAQNETYIIDELREANNYAILNEEIATSILTLDDMDFAQTVIAQYLDKALKNIDDIDATVRRKKTSETYQLAHDLRDSSLYIGTERMAVISTFIYNHARKRNIPPLKDAVEELRGTFEKSRIALKEFVEKNAVV
jgi:hypothetical protein